MKENELSYQIRGAIFTVYYHLGPGLLESIYQNALALELREKGLKVITEAPISVRYKETELTQVALRADIIVENMVLIELKSVAELKSVHHKQVLTYLKLSGLRLGILVNFNVTDIKKGIYRKVNGLY